MFDDVSGIEGPSLIREGTIGGASPRTGDLLPPLPCTSSRVLPALVENARKAAAAHSARPLHERAQMLRRFRDSIFKRSEEFAKILEDECGKVPAEAWLIDLLPTADLAAYWCDEGAFHLEPKDAPLDPTVYPSKRATVERVPRGVIALITPWNFPVAIPLRTMFPALLAGNAVIFKPSEHAPRCGALIGEAATEVFGDGLVTVVQGDGAIAKTLIASGVDAVVFTGSEATGRKVARSSADALIPVALELGGKDAALVLEDADVERTARGLVWAAFANAGQNCAAVERVYATPSVRPKLEARIVELTRELVLGRDIGTLATGHQMKKVLGHLKVATDEGAQVLTGGGRPKTSGLWLEPAVVSNVARGSAFLHEETFGPILPIVEISDVEEGIEAVNAHPLALTASVWTRDLAAGEQVAKRLAVGVVSVNNHSLTAAIPSLPWSGTRASGYGVTNSVHALEHLTRTRVVFVDESTRKRELWWYPYTDSLVAMARALVTLKGGHRGLLAKTKAIFSLVRAAMTRYRVR